DLRGAQRTFSRVNSSPLVFRTGLQATKPSNLNTVVARAQESGKRFRTRVSLAPHLLALASQFCSRVSGVDSPSSDGCGVRNRCPSRETENPKYFTDWGAGARLVLYYEISRPTKPLGSYHVLPTTT